MDAQVGSFWLGEFMGSVSLSGDINYLDPRAGPNPVQVHIKRKRFCMYHCSIKKYYYVLN
jgi:hypothetical protein